MTRKLILIAAVALMAAIITPPTTAFAATCTDNYRVCVKLEQERKERASAAAAKPEGSPVASKPDPYRYKVEVACSEPSGDPNESDASRCRYALSACRYSDPPSDEVRYRFLRQLRTGGPWEAYDESCGLDSAPAQAPLPPPVPTFGQIQQAFRALPFAMPTVNIQPEGDVTLVNLPTYFEAQWPAAGLAPGEVSEKLQLLSWSVEFRIAPGTYNFDFGDGTRSGATKDLGGPHPEGKIRHTYEKPAPAAQVKVDGQLTGWFRVNGGAWEPIGTVAELQDEPVVTLQVREAKARLYSKQ